MQRSQSAQNFRLHVEAGPEDQLKAPVGELLREFGRLTGLDVGSRTEVRADDIEGRPDLGVTIATLLTGHLELKRPGLGARAERFTGTNKKQWNRFKALPNLVYTDGSEWSLYHSGELVRRVRIADDVSEEGAGGLDTEAISEFEALFREFLYWTPLSRGQRPVSLPSWRH